jgi:hypothetical protein
MPSRFGGIAQFSGSPPHRFDANFRINGVFLILDKFKKIPLGRVI